MVYGQKVSKALDENLETVKYLFHGDKNKDLILREFTSAGGERFFLACLDGMSNSTLIGEQIIKPIQLHGGKDGDMEKVVRINSVISTQSIPEAVDAVLNGDTALFQEGNGTCLICETKGFETRSVGEPTTESVIKGSQEAFNESIRTNITLVRRLMKNRNLCTEFITVGNLNNNACALLYLDDVINRDTLAEVRRRLENIEGDLILGTGMVEQLIEDTPLSLFPTTLSTERPDRVAGYLSSGRIAIVVDGVPFVTILPITLMILLDSPEGQSQRWPYGTVTLITRMFALLFTTMASAIYLALINFHQEMVPTQLLGAIVTARANIPFPSIVEVLMMELFFELIRTAGIRIPKALGGAISIVGALILGQSAVEAHLVSPVTLIVVALGGIGNSALPDYDMAFSIRILKIGFILLGSFLGFVGLAMGVVTVILLLANQTSCGVPMLSLQGLRWSNGSPLLYQRPLWKQESRPRELKTQKPRQAPKVSRRWELDGEEN